MLGEDLHEGRPTTSMKKGWLYRNSYDEKNLEIAPVLIQIEWWSRSSNDDPTVMIQIEWWSRSSPVMMIQIERWSRSEDDLKKKMTWRRDDPADTEKNTSAKNCVERIPSWLRRSVDVFVTLECIHLCILCIVTWCLFRDVSIMYLSHVVMPRCFNRED